MTARLRVLEIHTTLACNVACTFCGLRTLEHAGTIGALGGALTGDGPARDRLETRREWSVRRHVSQGSVPLPALLAAVRSAAELGCQVLTVSGGGEPLVVPERSFAVLDAGRDAGLRTRLVTNGTLLDAHRARAARLDVLTVSVLGPDADTHDAAAGAPGAFARLRAGLAGIRGPAIEVHTPLTPDVQDRLPEMAARVAELGASTWWVLPLKGAPAPVLREDAAQHASSLGLRHNLGHQGTTSGSGCAAAEGQLVVHADGTITPCCSMRWGSGDVLDRDIGAVWAGPWLAAVRAALAAGGRAPACRECADPSRELREA